MPKLRAGVGPAFIQQPDRGRTRRLQERRGGVRRAPEKNAHSAGSTSRVNIVVLIRPPMTTRDGEDQRRQTNRSFGVFSLAPGGARQLARRQN
jgi:hypothetical protein